MAQPMGITASDVEFGEATEEQRELAWELSTQGWDSDIPVDDYIEREEYLAQLELNRDGRTQHWVLALKGYPRQVIASCQSTRRPVLISDGSGRPARQGNAYSVSHVYTSSPYRRQGMAAYLLCRLQEQMDRDSDCSVLYSDSGRKYYESLGWHPIASHQATLTLITPSPQGAPTPSTQPRTVPIQESELPDLCQRDQLRLTKTFNCLPADGKAHFALLPTYPEISWHLARSDDTDGTGDTNDTNDSNGNTPPTPPTPTPGAITLNRRTWIYWAHDWREKRLRVLRIPRACDDESEEERAGLVAPRGQDEGDVKALLEAALGEAARCGLRKVVVWNPDDAVRAACKAVSNAHPKKVKVVFEGRVHGGIPSLRWKGGRRKVSEVVWEENYGYCWV
ncbi:lysine acetyltransferase [Staphylotrichum tortipilum]|uniref:Lysine acetyltransferase n=1 Tax=Staphylotrichum tortipilum TaxID=2831512 RepID=A0AAN6ML93_9PEZI|nr:lysine acetyltransferase [Staphylotrichum longicolle]